MKKFRISLRFYRSIAPACVLVTLACAYMLVNLGNEAIPMLIFVKLLTFFLFCLFVKFLKPNEFYYYYNLGIRRARLWSAAVAVDLPLFVGMIFMVHLLFSR